MGRIIREADLLPLLEALPDGLQTRLGESGSLVSGGEGQRVRLGRAMLRPSPRLVILDEPFTALDRERRQELLRRAKKLWRNATLICITHDVGESTHFERVIVMEHGRVLEDGRPTALVHLKESRYRRLLEAEQTVRRHVWANNAWRMIRLDDGRAVESIGKRHHDKRLADNLLAGSPVGRRAGSIGADRGDSSQAC
jgi:ATP-binding cassette subfamily B protein